MKQLNREELADPASEGGAIFVRHIHDEALMKLRSYNIQVPGRIVRGKYSKVQNNVVEVFVGQRRQDFFTELQCLHRKDAPTIATAIISALESAIGAFNLQGPTSESRPLVHCLTGDGIYTNAKAARYVLEHFSRSLARSPLMYRLILVQCAVHAASLVVQVCITGLLLRDPVNNCDLTAACSRWFKHILPANMEDVHWSLQTWLEANGTDVLARGVPQDLEFLYGPALLPPGLLSLLRGDADLPAEERTRQLLLCSSAECYSGRLGLPAQRKLVVGLPASATAVKTLHKNPVRRE